MPTLDRNTILAAIGYAVLTGLLNLVFSRKSQIEAWCGANPRLAAFGKLLRAIGFDPHGVWAFMTLLITKKLPQVQLADGPAAMREIVKAEEKAEEKRRKGPPDDGGGPVSLMPEPVKLVAQDRSRLHNDRPDEPVEFRGWDWRPALRMALALAVVTMQLGCPVASKPPCDESKLRAIDADYAAKVIAVCLPKYDSKEACPEWPALQANHRRELKEACP